MNCTRSYCQLNHVWIVDNGSDYDPLFVFESEADAKRFADALDNGAEPIEHPLILAGSPVVDALILDAANEDPAA